MGIGIRRRRSATAYSQRAPRTDCGSYFAAGFCIYCGRHGDECSFSSCYLWLVFLFRRYDRQFLSVTSGSSRIHTPILIVNPLPVDENIQLSFIANHSTRPRDYSPFFACCLTPFHISVLMLNPSLLFPPIHDPTHLHSTCTVQSSFGSGRTLDCNMEPAVDVISSHGD